MRPEIAARVAEELKKHKDLICNIRKEMKFLRKQSGLSFEEISYLSGCSIREIKAQEEGKTAANLRIISSVVLIYYMFVYENVPVWLYERLFLFRQSQNTVW